MGRSDDEANFFEGLVNAFAIEIITIIIIYQIWRLFE